MLTYLVFENVEEVLGQLSRELVGLTSDYLDQLCVDHARAARPARSDVDTAKCTLQHDGDVDIQYRVAVVHTQVWLQTLHHALLAKCNEPLACLLVLAHS